MCSNSQNLLVADSSQKHIWEFSFWYLLLTSITKMCSSNIRRYHSIGIVTHLLVCQVWKGTNIHLMRSLRNSFEWASLLSVSPALNRPKAVCTKMPHIWQTYSWLMLKISEILILQKSHYYYYKYNLRQLDKYSIVGLSNNSDTTDLILDFSQFYQYGRD